MKYLLLLIFSIISCSFIDDRIYSIDPEFEPYYLMFLDEGEKRGFDYSGRDVIIYFGEMDDRMGNSHQRWSDNVIEITIDPRDWYYDISNSADYMKHRNEVTMMHEFGHAFLNREHIDNCMSVMKTKDICQYIKYQDFREEMLNELFMK